MSLTIAIDYDKTWTEDPEMWRTIAELMRDRGHTVILCTMRGEHPKNFEDFENSGVPHWMRRVCTNQEPKRDYCRSVGILVDIWIDDAPYFITNHSPGVTFEDVQ